MKKQFLIAIAIVSLISTAVNAQDSIQRKTMQDPEFRKGIFGVRFMPSFSPLQIQNYQGNTIKGEFMLGYGYGGLLGFNLNKNVGLQLEVIYNQFSQKFKDDNLDRRLDINYVNIPLLLSINTNRTRTINLNGVIGPQWGINVGAKLETTGTANGNGNAQAILAVKKNDFGIAYGAGLDFGLNPMHTIRLDVGFRGVMGLIDVSDRSGTIETNSYYIMTKSNINTYSAYLGLTFLF